MVEQIHGRPVVVGKKRKKKAKKEKKNPCWLIQFTTATKTAAAACWQREFAVDWSRASLVFGRVGRKGAMSRRRRGRRRRRWCLCLCRKKKMDCSPDSGSGSQSSIGLPRLQGMAGMAPKVRLPLSSIEKPRRERWGGWEKRRSSAANHSARSPAADKIWGPRAAKRQWACRAGAESLGKCGSLGSIRLSAQ